MRKEFTEKAEIYYPTKRYQGSIRFNDEQKQEQRVSENS